MNKILEECIPAIPPTANTMQRTGHRTSIRYSTEEYSRFKAEVEYAMRKLGLFPGCMDQYKDTPMYVEVLFCWSKWWTKDGKLRKQMDSDNRVKALFDAVFRFLGLCDSRIVTHKVSKCRPITGESSVITIMEIE